MKDFFYILVFTLFAVFSIANQMEQEEKFKEEINILEKKIANVRELNKHDLEVQSDIFMEIIGGKHGDW